MKVRLHEPTFGNEEITAAVEVMRSTMVTAGEKVRKFEQEFSRPNNGIMVNSGSSANLLAISALMAEGRLSPGDEVVVPALCWSTTVWPLIQHGLIPVFVDIDPDTLNIDPAAINVATTPKIRAIMPVHVYGNPCNMDAIRDICSDYRLALIEDCCEALGATYGGQPVGSFGDIGTFSFYFSHHITTFEGGMCVTGSRRLAEMMRIQRAHGWVRDCLFPDIHTRGHQDIDPRFLFVNSGYNLRPTEVDAAIGMVQLPKLEGFVESRRENASNMIAGLNAIPWLTPQKEQPGGESSWFGLPITISKDVPFTVGEIRKYLSAYDIETRPVICGNVARQPGFLKHPHRIVGDLENANAVMDRGFSLPCHQGMGAAECGYVLRTIGRFLEAYR